MLHAFEHPLKHFRGDALAAVVAVDDDIVDERAISIIGDDAGEANQMIVIPDAPG